MSDSDPQQAQGMVIFEMPPIPREVFASDDDYQRAVVTSQERNWGHPGSEVFVPDGLITEALLALHANHHAVGMGVLHDAELSREEADKILAPLVEMETHEVMIDYLKGRPIKLQPLERVEGGYSFRSDLYNRDNPTLSAEEVVAQVIEGARD